MKRAVLVLFIMVVTLAGLFLFLDILDPQPVAAISEQAAAPGLSTSPVEQTGLDRTLHDNRGPVSGVPQTTGSSFSLNYPGYQHFEPAFTQVATPTFARVHQSNDWVDGQYEPFASVAFTVTDSSGGYKGEGSGIAGPDGWMNGEWAGADIVPSDNVSVTSSGGFSAVVDIIAIDGHVDLAADLVTGTMSGGVFPVDGYVEVQRPPITGTAMPISITASGTFTADFSGAFDILEGDEVWAWYVNPDGNHVGASAAYPFLELYVNYAHDWVNGRTSPGAGVVVTLTDSTMAVKATAFVTASGSGDFSTDCSSWSTAPDCPNIEVSDSVFAAGDGQIESVDPIGSITADLDAAENTVSGTLNAPFMGMLEVRCAVWVEMGPPEIITTADADGGSFLCDFDDVSWDLEPGQDVAVMYVEPDGDLVINVLGFPWVRANYAHEWVGVNYEAGHTFWITLTDSSGSVKATAVADTFPNGGWSGDGFDTMDWQWLPEQPDIMPGDKVTFLSDDGYYNLLEIGQVNGSLDVAADAITGTLNVSWYTETLPVECQPWSGWNDGLDLESKSSSAKPDGSTTWSCSWAGEWDIVPGKDVAVMYLEPDIDRVIDVYRDPTPYLRVNKWANSAPAEGGNFVFHLEYWNDGDADAENVVLTDTLEGFAYLMDTSPYAVTTGTIPGGEYAAWDLGTVPPGTYGWFDLFVGVAGVESNTVTNTIQITTSNPFNESGPEERMSQWLGHVEANDTHLNIDKYAWTGDPAPGYDFVFAVNVCNNGSTASTDVVITDTLHPSMTLQTWWAQSPGWYELSSSAQELAVGYHSMEGFWCNEVYLEVNLDGGALPGMYLTNTAVITAANDLEWNDNFAFWEGNANEPHANLHLDKNFNWGVLAPGGQVAYGLNLGNDGNIPITTTILVTDFLPVSTTYNGSWYNDEYGQHPVTPTVVTNDYVVWEFPSLANGFWENWEVVLDIDGSVTPGTVLTNTAVVSPQPMEDSYDDNVDTWLETVYPPGPNLRITKYSQWNWEGQLNYWLQIDNIGTERVYTPTITDSFPVSTTFNGEWWTNFWQGVEFTDDSGAGHLLWTLDWLEPGWSTGIGFNVDLDGPIIGQGGLFFTNTADVSAPGLVDVFPDDNSHTIVMPSGPDIYIDKWANTNSAEIGDIVTFTVEFGNANVWPWDTGPNTTITDTLPPEMTFITATAPWDPNQPWAPVILPDNVLVWDWGQVWNSSSWQFQIVAQVNETAAAGQLLTNNIEMYSDDPNDVEPDYNNNASSASLTIFAPAFTISKGYESAEIAGLPVSYTLTFSNTGNLVGTGIVVTDMVPANVTWVSGGSYNPGTGIVSWIVPTLDAGQTADIGFVGTLACSGSAVNDDYMVTGSNEGPGSPVGPPVAFTIQAPTIVADFIQSLTTVEPGETIVFTSTSTTNGTPFVTWAWDFGDGNTGSGAVTSHAYDTPGTYDVELTITDGCGYSDTIVIPNAVTVEEPVFSIYMPVVLKP
ncbi:MAG: PKD domain-containing protein [Candidatus Promineifilaceae bacterium]